MNVVDNEADKRFEAQIDGFVIRIDYIKTRDKIYLAHTEVPRALEGRGLATQMVKTVLERIKEGPLALVPLCPFVAAHVKKNPEWAVLLAPGYSV